MTEAATAGSRLVPLDGVEVLDLSRVPAGPWARLSFAAAPLRRPSAAAWCRSITMGWRCPKCPSGVSAIRETQRRAVLTRSRAI